MRLLFISYWSLSEPLTNSTILPYLRMLRQNKNIVQVIFVTVERNGSNGLLNGNTVEGIHHIGIKERWAWAGPFSKADLLVRMIVRLFRLVRRERIDLIDAKSSPAGAIAHLLSLVSGVPYMVESFEPHSDYMVGTGVWAKTGLYYWISRLLENAQRRRASLLVTVTRAYRDKLLAEGLPSDRVKVIPSVVDTELFVYDPHARARVRGSLGWGQDSLVGIYVGKFGGLYYDTEAFGIFKKALGHMGDRFRLIVLSIDDQESITQRLISVGFSPDRFIVRRALHEDVPNWLSASDMAFSTIRYIPAGLYQSPVKNGEYWANGLPVLLTDKVSDDHRIIEQNPWSGALFRVEDEQSIDRAILHIRGLLQQGVQRERIMALAVEHRSIRIARDVYDVIFGLNVPGSLLTSLRSKT